MAASETLVFDIAAVDGGARRPSLDDVGSAILEDKAGTKAPPQDGKHLYKNMCNQWQLLLAALGRTAHPVIITVGFSGGTPFIDKIQAAGTNVVSADFTLVDNGVGSTSIQWTGTTLPAPTCDPLLSLSSVGVHCGGAILTLNATPGVHDITVRTTVGATGAAADVRFTVAIN